MPTRLAYHLNHSRRIYLLPTPQSSAPEVFGALRRIACVRVSRTNYPTDVHTQVFVSKSTFPPTVELVAGPGCKTMLLPDYPASPSGIILESDYVLVCLQISFQISKYHVWVLIMLCGRGRQLREIDF